MHRDIHRHMGSKIYTMGKHYRMRNLLLLELLSKFYTSIQGNLQSWQHMRRLKGVTFSTGHISKKRMFLEVYFQTRRHVLSESVLLDNNEVLNRTFLFSKWLKLHLHVTMNVPVHVMCMFQLISLYLNVHYLRKLHLLNRWIEKYADNESIFFEDFKNAYLKLVNSGARWNSL
jgi:hypothetical protein